MTVTEEDERAGSGVNGVVVMDDAEHAIAIDVAYLMLPGVRVQGRANGETAAPVAVVDKNAIARRDRKR